MSHHKTLIILQVRELVEAMHEKTVAKGCYVIREGERSHMRAH